MYTFINSFKPIICFSYDIKYQLFSETGQTTVAKIAYWLLTLGKSRTTKSSTKYKKLFAISVQIILPQRKPGNYMQFYFQWITLFSIFRPKPHFILCGQAEFRISYLVFASFHSYCRAGSTL